MYNRLLRREPFSDMRRHMGMRSLERLAAGAVCILAAACGTAGEQTLGSEATPSGSEASSPPPAAAPPATGTAAALAECGPAPKTTDQSSSASLSFPDNRVAVGTRGFVKFTNGGSTPVVVSAPSLLSAEAVEGAAVVSAGASTSGGAAAVTVAPGATYELRAAAALATCAKDGDGYLTVNEPLPPGDYDFVAVVLVRRADTSAQVVTPAVRLTVEAGPQG